MLIYWVNLERVIPYSFEVIMQHGKRKVQLISKFMFAT